MQKFFWWLLNWDLSKWSMIRSCLRRWMTIFGCLQIKLRSLNVHSWWELLLKLISLLLKNLIVVLQFEKNLLRLDFWWRRVFFAPRWNCRNFIFNHILRCGFAKTLLLPVIFLLFCYFSLSTVRQIRLNAYPLYLSCICYLKLPLQLCYLLCLHQKFCLCSTVIHYLNLNSLM